MTNPGDAVGTNGGYGGRTSVNAFNDVLSAFSDRGIVKGWTCVPKTGMTVSLGGQEMVRDVAIAKNDLGQFTTIDNISVQPIDVTLSDAPTLGQRVDAIVAYVTNPPDSNGQLIDNPDACGLIVVESSVTTNPTAPDEAMIREAITADGGSGVTAYYVVLATVQIGTGTNVITNTEITQGDKAIVPIPDGSITSQKVDWTTFSAIAEPTSVTSLALNTSTRIQSLTIPATGKWKISAQFSGYSTAQGTYNIEAIIKKNDNNTLVINDNFSAASTQINMNFQAFDAIDANSGDTVDFYIRAIDHTITAVNKDSCKMIAERIG